jgi:hypothetical protein
MSSSAENPRAFNCLCSPYAATIIASGKEQPSFRSTGLFAAQISVDLVASYKSTSKYNFILIHPSNHSADSLCPI